MTLTDEQLKIHTRLQYDLPFYSANCLRIKDKVGALVPFEFNRAQMYLHERIELQLAKTGKVRIIIVKGRQQGCSTYVAARYFHKAIWKPYLSVYILSHEKTSTDNLFDIVKRYRDNLPLPVQPKLEASNSKELEFSNKSHYRVGTAGQSTTGRSQTNQLFHGSEVAYYENIADISTGVLQTIADMPGTEVILESTANGIGNFFHKTAQDALKGIGDYEIVFIPWFWQPEYRATVPPDFEFTADERRVQSTHGLTDEQLYWRHNKIIFLKSEALFKQEYPCTPQEAFQSSGSSLLKAADIESASFCRVKEPKAPLILGVDPARTGDRTTIVHRRGRSIVDLERWHSMDPMRLAGIVAERIERNAGSFGQAFIDVAEGIGTISRLKELGFGPEVTGVAFGSKALREDVYLNKRAEMAADMRDWFEEGDVSIPKGHPLFDEFVSDLLCVPEFKITSNSKFKLVPKDDIIKEFGMSPDFFDAAMLTFAFPVANKAIEARRRYYHKAADKGSSLQTLNRCRRMRKSQNSRGNL